MMRCSCQTLFENGTARFCPRVGKELLGRAGWGPDMKLISASLSSFLYASLALTNVITRIHI